MSLKNLFSKTPRTHVLPEDPRHVARALVARAVRHLDAADRARAGLSSAEAVRAWQSSKRDILRTALGPWPERAPLRPTSVGTSRHDGFTVERIRFESAPGLTVTGVLYLPPGTGPHPAALVPCGHGRDSKADPAYQRACILLARNGIAAFCFDPIGQGERRQLLKRGRGVYPATVEHVLLGPALAMVGWNVATFMVFDGLAALDYLVSRNDIDPSRLAATGNSGGGTQTCYLMALDQRIRAAAPSCYITGFRSLLQSIGPQDTEQTLHDQVALGLDHADYLILNAPRPTLVCSAERDFFDIEGARAAIVAARPSFAALKAQNALVHATADAVHGFSRGLRLAMVAFLKNALGVETPLYDREPEPLAEPTLRCTETGQVLHAPGARTVLDLVDERASQLATPRNAHRAPRPLSERRDEIRRVTRYPALDLPVATKAPSVKIRGLDLEAWILQGPIGIPVPMLHAAGDPERNALLLLDPRGMHFAVQREGRRVLRQRLGEAIHFLDPPGIGETLHVAAEGVDVATGGPNWPDVMTAFLLGLPYVTLRAAAIGAAVRWLENRYRTITVRARGELVLPTLVMAALEPGRVLRIEVDRMPALYEMTERSQAAADTWIHVIQDGRSVFDLADLVALIDAELIVERR